ncbi:MAG TPA: PKD domain-containing protein, partial [Thermoanaerobaculia bacterium]
MSRQALVAYFVAVAASVGVARPCAAQAVSSFFIPDAPESPLAVTPPSFLGRRIALKDQWTLASASEAERGRLDALRAWNRIGNRPSLIGFSRSLPESVVAKFGSSEEQVSVSLELHAVRSVTERGSVAWATAVTVRKAFALRLHLTGVSLPTGTKIWVYGTRGDPIAVNAAALSPRGDLWTPTIFGDSASLEVELPSADSAGDLTIAELAEWVAPAVSSESGVSPEAEQAPTCLQDASCVTENQFPAIALARKAVAQLEFMSNGSLLSCTGTLLNDAKASATPYLLTANHCIPTQEEATTLEAFWDFYDASCGGPPPSMGSLARSNGGTLLASSAVSDFSFIQLNSVPSGRSFMGWDSRASSVTSLTPIFRVSHPEPGGVISAQTYSETLADTEGRAFCTFARVGIANRPQFIYSSTLVGDVYPGSSGAAAMLGDGSVIGQLLGTCPMVADSCTQPHEITDGAFSETYPSIAQWLNPDNTPPPSSDFRFSPANPTAGEPVVFTDMSAGSPTSWSWNFGDPDSGDTDSASTQNPSHMFAGAGAYFVTLTAGNRLGSSETSRLVVVGGKSNCKPSLTGGHSS